MSKQFPFDFDATKDILFYPKAPELFSGDILEIGPGRGDLLLTIAGHKPDQQFVAIELGNKRYVRLIPRLEKRGLRNILLLRGDARIVLPRYFKEETFEKIFVLFPDPWPKKKHAFRRLLSVEFLWLLTSMLKNHGSLMIASDVARYIEWVIINLNQIHLLKNALEPHAHLPELPELPKTYFEKKWRDAGRKTYFLKYNKSPL